MNIQLGTPKQTMTALVVDTGSSPLWVAGQACVLNNGQGSGQCASSLFNPTTSGTYQLDANFGPFNARYGDGT